MSLAVNASRSTITAVRYHDISCGHRVSGHENKCRSLHGHNYRITFFCDAPSLDELGRVIDFGCIKTALCDWLEAEWDHRCLIWAGDPILGPLQALDPTVLSVPFNPTAENMAEHLLLMVGPARLPGNGVTLRKVLVEETRKCSASAEI